MTAKTTITDKPAPKITYIFESATAVVRISAKNYREARRMLNNWSGGQTGYKLRERVA